MTRPRITAGALIVLRVERGGFLSERAVTHLRARQPRRSRAG